MRSDRTAINRNGFNARAAKPDLETLRMMTEYKSALFDHHPDPIFSYDLNGVMQHLNAAAERLLGCGIRELRNAGLTNLPVLESCRSTRRSAFAKSMNGLHQQYEAEFALPCGKVIHAAMRCFPVVADDDRIIGVFETVTGMVDRAGRAEELRTMETELLESEKRLRTFINAMPDLVIFKDTDSRWVEANEATLAIFRLENVSYQGMSDPQLAAKSELYKNTLMACNLPDQSVWEHGKLAATQMTITHPEGGAIICDVIKVPLYHGDGSRKGLVVIGRNITELKQTEAMLRKSEKLAVVGQLAAGIAHEIRNPLTVLKGFLKLIAAQTTERNSWYLDVMLTEIEQMEWTTTQFMTIAKPQELQFAQHDVRGIVEDVTAFLYPLATMNNVQIMIKTEIGLPPVLCDDNQLKQVFINVMKNAIESMQDGGQMEIAISRSRSSAGHASVQIIDTGCGIPPERMGNLGEPFYSLKEKGTGLGLMICCKIMKDHGGRLDISSQVGLGTTVELVFPFQPAS